MKTLAIALGACVVAALTLYYILVLFGISGEIAKAMATIVLGGFAKLREVLEKIRAERGIGPPLPEVRSMSEYELPFWVAVAYASVSLFVVVFITSAVPGFFAALYGESIDSTLLYATPVILLATAPAILLAGRWIGYRAKRPFLTAIFCAFIARVLLGLAEWYIVPADTFKEMVGQNKTLETEFSMVGWGILFYATLLLLGALWGRKQRLSRYFRYLLKQVSPTSRTILAELAYEEAVQMRKSAPRARPGEEKTRAEAG